MDGPINYNIDVKNPFQEYVKGLQLGAAAKQIQAQQAQEAQMQMDIQDLSKNPTADGILQTMLKYPSLKDAYAPAYNALSAKDQQAMINKISPVFYALQSGNNAAALGAVQQQIEAAKNSGMEKDAADAQRIFDMIKTDPNRAKLETGAAFAATAPDQYNKVAESLRQEAVAPYQQQEASAKATKAQYDAIYAPSQNAAALANTQSQIDTRGQDLQISQEKLAVTKDLAQSTKDKNAATANAATKNAEATAYKLGNDQADRKAKAVNEIAQLDSTIAVFDQLGEFDKDKGVHLFRGGASNATGPLAGRLPDLYSKSREYQGLLDLAKSQVFLNSIPAMAGFGSLSNEEGKALMNSMVVLGNTQDAEVLSKNFKVAKTAFTKMKENAMKKYGMSADNAAPPSDGKLVFVRGPDGKIIQQPVGAK